MENLTLEATKSSPAIIFDARTGVLEIKGKSYPENAAKFFSPIFEWLTTYVETTDDPPVRVVLEINYLNSSSSKAVLNLLDILDAAAKRGRQVIIDWRYRQDDDVALECGEEFKEDVEAAVFNLVEMIEG
jgi:hypothetical protein